MCVPPFLKVYGAANILFLFSLLDMCLVNHILLVAVVFDGTILFLVALAIATSLGGVLFSSNYFAVVAFDYSTDVFGGAVGHFHSVAVDDLSQGVSFRETIFNQLEEFGANFGFHCLIPWGIKPEYVVPVVFLFPPGWLVRSGFFIFQSVVVSAIFEGCLVITFGFVELISRARDGG